MLEVGGKKDTCKDGLGLISSLWSCGCLPLPRIHPHPPFLHVVILGVPLDRIPSLTQLAVSPLFLYTSRMARDCPGHSPRQQGQRPCCPLCNQRFADILRHLNHRRSKCADWFNSTIPSHHLPPDCDEHATENTTDFPIPDHFSNTQQPALPSHNQPQLHHVKFSGAAKTYGRVATFMDRFHNDKYSGFCTSNIYYPLAGKNEWELASFLLSSGLSMRKIDEFLRLKMVAPSLGADPPLPRG